MKSEHNLPRPASRTHTEDIIWNRGNRGTLLWGDRSVSESIHMETRIPYTRKRYGSMEYAPMKPNGAICRDKDPRCSRQRRRRTEKELAHRGMREGEIRGTRLRPGVHLLENEKETETIRTEWREMGIADNCVQTLLKI